MIKGRVIVINIVNIVFMGDNRIRRVVKDKGIVYMVNKIEITIVFVKIVMTILTMTMIMIIPESSS